MGLGVLSSTLVPGRLHSSLVPDLVLILLALPDCDRGVRSR